MSRVLMALMLSLSLPLTAMAQEQLESSGKIVSVRVIPRTFSIYDDKAKEVIRYAVPLNTEVTIAGGKARLGHLRADDRIVVTYRRTDSGREAIRVDVPQATASLDQRVREGIFSTVSGEIVAIKPSQRTFTLRGDQSGERHSYAVPGDARVTVAGENARLTDLRRGDRVTIRFKPDETQQAGAVRQVARVRVPEPVAPLAERRGNSNQMVAQVQQAPRSLPRTAGQLPPFAIFAVFALIAAASIRLLRSVGR